jgi:putative hydrolase of the HAD superfamily
VSNKFAGVAFDLDGTLYSNSHFYFRLIPFALRHWPLMLAMGRARKLLHGGGLPNFPAERFYDVQAEIMAKALGKPPELVREQAERLIYRGWERVFGRLPLFPHVREVLEDIRRAGLKLALLSDFPPEQKLINFGIKDLWDIVLCSEEIGRLKPDPLPFQTLAAGMGLPPDQILYVGNSLRYDVRGAKSAGMSAAWISPSPFRAAKSGGGRGRGKAAGADFVFTGYRQLSAFVLS